ncbi:unnamed protein product [Ectocarpus sp. 12 AP-2014]
MWDGSWRTLEQIKTKAARSLRAFERISETEAGERKISPFLRRKGRNKVGQTITHQTGRGGEEREAASRVQHIISNGSTRSPCGEFGGVRERVPVVLLQRLLPPPHRGRGERLLLIPGVSDRGKRVFIPVTTWARYG